ncbi:MAG: low molecular weight protein-tyrosine-phosphatase [Celeribacter sp.]|jgi:protein-tyrosine phosphatase
MTYKILCVCLGNICRSPTAEVVLRAQAKAAGLHVSIDSAGTGGWHIGDPPDARMQAAGRARGLDLAGLRARQVSAEDFEQFDLILAMDRQNRADLERLRPAGNAVPVRLMLSWDAPQGGSNGPAATHPERDVPDPYYEGGFDHVIDLIERSGSALMAEIAARKDQA